MAPAATATTQSTKVFKVGRICIVLKGRFAGKKAVVMAVHDSGTRNRPFSHALVLGIEEIPKFTKKMKLIGAKKDVIAKVFLKHISYTHLMPTRYVTDFDPKTLIGEKPIETPEEKMTVKQEIGKIMMQKFRASGTNQKMSRDVAFLRSRLRF